MAQLPDRRSLRIRGYDYANKGAYYLTICTPDRSHLMHGEAMVRTNASPDTLRLCVAAPCSAEAATHRRSRRSKVRDNPKNWNDDRSNRDG
ncbi:MAG: hypothetical protein QM724_11085 [Flavobacteriales bacterium]